MSQDVRQSSEIAKKQGGQMATITPTGLPEWFAGSKEQSILSTIPLSTDIGFALAARASVAKDGRICDMVGKEITISHWLCSPYDGVDEDTGEQVSGVRIALVTPDEQVYVTYSFGVRRVLQLLVAKYGLAQWDPPLTFRVESVPSRLGSMLILVPVTPSVTPRAAKK